MDVAYQMVRVLNSTKVSCIRKVRIEVADRVYELYDQDAYRFAHTGRNERAREEEGLAKILASYCKIV